MAGTEDNNHYNLFWEGDTPRTIVGFSSVSVGGSSSLASIRDIPLTNHYMIDKLCLHTETLCYNRTLHL
jgi:hypothetical protein